MRVDFDLGMELLQHPLGDFDPGANGYEQHMHWICFGNQYKRHASIGQRLD